MNNKKTKFATITTISTLLGVCLGMGGCMDVEYKYDVPKSQTDCPSGMNYRSGGSNIKDRSGGSNIKDRSGNTVDAYCEENPCPSGVWEGDPVMDWHLTKGKFVVANRVCVASP